MVVKQAQRATYLRASRFVGRKQLQQHCLELLHRRCRTPQKETSGKRRKVGKERPPACLALTGESGIGKSRFMEEIRRSAERGRVGILQGNSYEEGNVAYQPFVEMLEGVRKSRLTASQRQALRDLFDGILQERHTPSYAAPQTGKSSDPRLRLQASLADFLIDLCQRRPLALLLDNFHWADPGTTAFLPYLLHAIHLREQENKAALPLLVLLGCRCESAQDSDAPAPLALLQKNALVQTELLEGLSPEEMREMISSILELEPVPPELMREMVHVSAGNPLFLEEVLKNLAENGTLYYRRHAWHFDPHSFQHRRLPESLKGILQERLKRIPDRSRELLELLAVFNRPVSAYLLKKSVPGEASWIPRHLLSLVERRLLSREVPKRTHQYYYFRHVSFREVLYEQIPDEKRRTLHRAIGEMVEGLNAGHLEEKAEELAYHYSTAGIGDKTLEYGLMAGRKLRSLGDNAAAIEHFQNALKHIDPRRFLERCRLLREIAELHSLNGDFPRAQETLTRILEDSLARINPREIVQTRRSLADVLCRSGEYDRAQRQLQEAALHAVITDRLQQAGLLEQMARVSLHQGHPETALDLCRSALGFIQGTGDNFEAALTYTTLAHINYLQGKFPEASEHCRSGLAVTESIGRTDHAATLNNLLGMIADGKGLFREAIEQYGKSLEGRERLGDLLGISACLNNIGYAHFNRGEYTPALDFFERSLRLSRRIENHHSRAMTLNNIGLVYASTGCLDLADGHASQALSIASHYEIPSELANGWQTLGLVELERGRWKKAREAFDNFLHHYARWQEKRELCVVHLHQAELYRRWRLPRLASRRLAEATRLLQEVDAQDLLIRALLLRSQLGLERLQRASRSKDKAQAAAQLKRIAGWLQDALRVPAAAEMPQWRWKIHLAAHQVYEQLGEAKTSQRHWRAARQELRKILRQVPTAHRKDFARLPEVAAAAPALQVPL